MAHDQILRRFYPERVTETSKDSAKTRIKAALDEIKDAASALTLQEALDVSSAIMDIEVALAPKAEE